MTRLRLMNRLRREDWYKPTLAVLAELGITDFAFCAPSGTGHPILKFTVNGSTHRMPVPSSGGRAAATYVPAEIRRKARSHA